MQRLKLEVSLREATGKGVARKLRAAGVIPAVFYGHGLETVSLQIGALHLERAIHGGANALIDLEGPKQVKNKPVLIKDLQRNPATRRLLHCDLFAVDLEEKLTVDVPIHFIGRAIGVVEQGGVLETLTRQLQVSCMPLAIPESIEIDVSGLSIGDSVHVRDVSLPEGVEAILDADFPVVHVVTPRVEEEVKEDEEEAAAVGEETPEGETPPPPAAEDGGEA